MLEDIKYYTQVSVNKTFIPVKNQKIKVTLFCVPKHFCNHIDTIQRNAISSWTQLLSKPDIILMRNDKGVRTLTVLSI